MMKIITGGVTAAKGFEAAATAAKIKYQDRTDMAIIYSQVPCVCAGTFTTNVVKAACVKWDQQIVAGGQKAQAVIVNSGIANACTGAEGFGYCKETADAAAEALGISADGVLIGSTGVIGKQLPIDRIKAGVKALAQKKNTSLENGTEAAKAIMTTDTCEKQIAVEIEVGGKTVTIGGMAKGSGMIHPNMGTMLCFITTDCAVDPSILRTALQDAVAHTFNRISVDGDTSTNDTCVIMANGMAGNELIDWKNEDYHVFYDALYEVALTLAKKMAADGEGASKLICCTVRNSRAEEYAERLAKAVIASSLVKAAMFGADANWGRILCAMGYSKAPFRPEYVTIGFSSAAGSITVCQNGRALDFDEDMAKKILLEKEVSIDVDIQEGDAEATAYGCDLTYDYVRINGDYRT